MSDDDDGPSPPAGQRPFEQLGRFLVRGAMGTLGLQAATIVLSLGTSLVLARALGAAGLGAYSYGLTWANLLLLPATLGLGPVIAREVAVSLTEERWSTIAGLRRFSGRAALGVSALVIAGAGVASALARSSLGEALFWPLVVSLPLVALNSQTWMLRFALVGLRRVVIAQWAESVVRPAVFLAALAALWLVLGETVDPAWAMGLQVLAAAAALVGMVVISARVVPPEARDATPVEEPSLWLRSAMPLLLVAVARQVNQEASILVMGSMLEEADIGIYRVAHRVAAVLTYVLLALNQAFNPVAASLFAQGDLKRIEVLGIRVSRGALLVTLPLFALMIGFDTALLSVFGADFTGGEQALWILGLGQLFNVAAGPVAVVLIMTRHEGDTARALGFTMLVTLVLNVLLIGSHGLEGAAIATAVGQVLWNVLLLGYVYKRLGLVLSAFSWRWLRP